MNKQHTEKIGFWALLSIGIGGMVGGGIFAVLGIAVQLSKGGTPIAFLLAGLIALLTSYSYARLSVTYPSQGGTVEFINQAFGSGFFTGSLNILLWISYINMLSLYAYAFGSYGAAFLPEAAQPLGKHLLISGAIVLFTILNFLGSKMVGEAEEWIVSLKIIILFLFIGAGIWTVKAQQIAPSTWSSISQLVTGGMIIFLAYEGFELIANASQDAQDRSTSIPRAYYASVIFVIMLYVLVSIVTVGNLSLSTIVTARDYALAESARPFLGSIGFILIAIAALLSTGSAINATLYGTARISYIIAKEGELPEMLERKIWNRPLEGLIITSGITMFIANFFDLSSIAMIGSSGFLLIFAIVNLANIRLHRQTTSNVWLSASGAAACFGAFVTLVWQRAVQSPKELLILALMILASFVVEAVYSKVSGRSIHSSAKSRAI